MNLSIIDQNNVPHLKSPYHMAYILAAHYSRITLKCSVVPFPVMGRNDLVLIILLFPLSV